MKRSKCSFVPTCSNYTVQSVQEYGVLKGIVLGIWRIVRCNPFNRAYHDPPVNWGEKFHLKKLKTKRNI